MRQGKRSHTPEEREGEYHSNTLYRHKPLRLLLNQRLDGPGITEAGAADSHEKQDYNRYRHNNALNHDCCCYTLNAACHSCNDNQYGEDCQTDTVILTGQNLEDSSAARNSRNRTKVWEFVLRATMPTRLPISPSTMKLEHIDQKQHTIQIAPKV